VQRNYYILKERRKSIFNYTQKGLFHKKVDGWERVSFLYTHPPIGMTGFRCASHLLCSYAYRDRLTSIKRTLFEEIFCDFSDIYLLTARHISYCLTAMKISQNTKLTRDNQNRRVFRKSLKKDLMRFWLISKRSILLFFCSYCNYFNS
jgi:hypothetical protein